MSTRTDRNGKPLPPIQILEEMQRIGNQEIDGDAELTRMLSDLDRAKATWRRAAAEFDTVRFLLEGLPAQIAGLEAEVAALNERRPAVVAAALLAHGRFTADDELLARRAELLLNIERLRIAKPALEAEAHLRNRLVGQAANPAQNIEDAIDKRRRELKLAEARRRCGF